MTAPGASCRSQLGDRDAGAEAPPHPIEKVAAALTGPATGADEPASGAATAPTADD